MESIFVYASLLACLYFMVNMFALPQTPSSANESCFTAINLGEPHSQVKHKLCTHMHTHHNIIKIINRHWTEMVSKESHLPINYGHKILPARSLINSRAVTQKEMSSDKWAHDLKAARSAKHFPLHFISNFTVNHQPQLATLGNRKTG